MANRCAVPERIRLEAGAARKAAGENAAAFAALGDGVRLAILAMLAKAPSLCVCEIQQAFALGQPTISHHLRVLREAGLVDCERRGVWAHYSLRREAVKRLAHGLLEVL